jgi:RNA polymerase sigma-70 factor (ECF subfamily)
MTSLAQEAKLAGLAGYVSAVPGNSLERYFAIYEEHCHRVFSLAFYMTESEPGAEELTRLVFCRAFARSAEPAAEAIDDALLAELRELMPLGTLTLEAPRQPVTMPQRNLKRTELERAVAQLPPTERLVFLLHDVERYQHARIAKLLGIDPWQSQQALHAARLAIRYWVATHNQ